MSERTRVHDLIMQELTDHHDVWNAPYGILSNLQEVPKGGYLRQITFGRARYLDATITIFSPNKITIEAAGPLAYKVDGAYTNVDDVLRTLQGCVLPSYRTWTVFGGTITVQQRSTDYVAFPTNDESNKHFGNSSSEAIGRVVARSELTDKLLVAALTNRLLDKTM